MSANLSGSWMTAFSASRLVQMAGVAIDTWPVGAPVERSPAISYHSSVSARSVEFLPDEAPHTAVFTSPGAVKHPQVILSEELFRSALVRERKRADRFDQVFAVVTIEADGADARPLLTRVAGAIGA